MRLNEDWWAVIIAGSVILIIVFVVMGKVSW